MNSSGEQYAPRRRLSVLVGVAAVVLAADLASKVAVVALLSGRPHVRLLGGVLTLMVTRNPGAAFGIGGPAVTVAFTAIAAGVAGTIARYSRRIGSIRWAVALGLLLGGAMGNLADRLFRFPGPLQGWVVDWIRFPHWPTFNIADSAITCGTLLVAVLAARGTAVRDVHQAGRGGPEPAAPSPSPAAPPALVLVPVLVPVPLSAPVPVAVPVPRSGEPGPAPASGPAGAAGPP
jgi:signal peptidase II